ELGNDLAAHGKSEHIEARHRLRRGLTNQHASTASLGYANRGFDGFRHAAAFNDDVNGCSDSNGNVFGNCAWVEPAWQQNKVNCAKLPSCGLLVGVDVNRNYLRSAGHARALDGIYADAADAEDHDDISAPHLTEIARSAVARRHC